MTDVKAIRALLINEVVPDDPRQDFHGSDTGAYAGSLISLFQEAGIGFRSMKDIDESGITVINAVNTPKQGRKITSLQMEVIETLCLHSGRLCLNGRILKSLY